MPADSRAQQGQTDEITDAMVEAAAIAIYEDEREDEYRGAEWDWPHIDQMYDWDGNYDELPDGKWRPDGDWLRDRIRAQARVVLTAGLAARRG